MATGCNKLQSILGPSENILVSTHLAYNMILNGKENVSKAFEFRKRSERLDWNLLAKTDVNFIFHTVELETLQENIRNVVCCCLEKEFDNCDLNPNVSKLFRLAQLIIEYLLFSQEVLKKKISNLEDRLQSETKERDSLQKELIIKSALVKSMKYELNRTRKGQKLPQSANYFQCVYCDKMFVTRAFLDSHRSRKHNEELRSSDSPVQHQKILDTNIEQKTENEAMRKDFNELQNELTRTKEELGMEKETTKELTNQMNLLRSHVDDLEQQLPKKVEEVLVPAFDRSVLSASTTQLSGEIESQRKIIEDLREQLNTSVEQTNRIVEEKLEKQAKKLDEEVIILRRHFEEELTAQTATLANIREAVHSEPKDAERAVPNPIQTEKSRTTLLTQVTPTMEPPLPMPRTRRRLAEKAGAPLPSARRFEESLTTYESEDEYPKEELPEDSSSEAGSKRPQEKDSARRRAVERSERSQGDHGVTRRREILSRRISSQASTILQNHFRSRASSETVITERQSQSQRIAPKRKTLVTSIIHSIKAAGRYLRGKPAKRKPWSSTLSLPVNNGTNIDLVIPSSELPSTSRPKRSSSSRDRRRVQQNVYDESPLSPASTKVGSDPHSPSIRAWSESDISNIENIKTTRRGSTERQPASVPETGYRPTGKFPVSSGKVQQMSSSEDESEESKVSRKSRTERVSVTVDREDSPVEGRTAEILRRESSRTTTRKQAGRRIAFNEQVENEEKSYEILSPVLSTSKYEEEKAALNFRIEELTRSIEEQLSSRTGNAPTGGVQILRKAQPRPSMYQDASDS